jgi:hypothetical protein
MITTAAANPGKLTYGHAGVGSIPHLAVENLAEASLLYSGLGSFVPSSFVRSGWNRAAIAKELSPIRNSDSCGRRLPSRTARSMRALLALFGLPRRLIGFGFDIAFHFESISLK